MALWNSILGAISLSNISGWLAGGAIAVTAIIWIYRRRRGPSGSAPVTSPARADAISKVDHAHLVDDTQMDVVTETPSQILGRFDGLTDIQAKQREGLYLEKITICECIVSDARHSGEGVRVFASAEKWKDVYVSVDYPKEWKAEAAGLQVGDRILIAGRITKIDPPILSIKATQPPRVR